ncbi:AAA family ATPase [Candidatus Woesearchaeota archaeon]|nr:AAA family ATPase [Candidatus Woesearchaeota archaeon]
MKTIIVTGTPGTGKTALAKKLSKKLGYAYIDVNKIIKDNKLKEGYDRKKKCYIVDTKKLTESLIETIKKATNDLIIDSHLSHYLPKKHVDLCIVTKCGLKELKKRLEKKKKYPKSKVRENLDCEIFDICLNEAREIGHKVIVINTTKGLNIDKIAHKINRK